MTITCTEIKKPLDRAVYENLLLRISENQRERINNFRVREHAEHSLIAELLIRLIIRQRLGLENEEIRFGLNGQGKPFLEKHPDFHFNLSHAGSWVVCAAGPHPVGVDVERIQPIHSSIAERFFSTAEAAWLSRIPRKKQLAAFFDLWVLKESYMKALGKGFSLPLHAFTVHPGEDEIAVFTDGKKDPWFFRRYHLQEGYKLAACSDQEDFPDRLTMLDLQNIIQGFCR